MAKKEQKEINKNKKSFFKGFKAELKKVSWPTPKQLANNTIAVITIVLITAVIVFALDLVFETMNKQGVDRLKEIISSNETTENTTSEDEEQTDENSTANQNETEEQETSEGETTENNVAENNSSEETTANQ